MPNQFPEPGWVESFCQKLNSDEQYARIARQWERDVCFIIEADETLAEQVIFYLDLWHGTCREARIIASGEECQAAFRLSAPYSSWVRVLKGELHPMQAMLTQKLKVNGNMAYMMRHVPTVLDFTRCAQEVTDAVIGGSGS